MKTNSPIGIFDSGIGGLTVAKALLNVLPHESVIYFGDTAHLPYGDKSTNVIQNYAKKIVDFLLAQKVKLILIACNSASAAAYGMLREYVGSRALLINVIDPMADFLQKNYFGKSVGLIATKLTVKSKVYEERLAQRNCNIVLHSLAAPLLVPIIEEGFADHALLDLALTEYLSSGLLQNIDALVLGCTHYPVIKAKILDFYHKRNVDVAVIDPSEIVANEVKSKLAKEGLLADMFRECHFYVSDYTDSFAHSTQLFFGSQVTIKSLGVL